MVETGFAFVKLALAFAGILILPGVLLVRLLFERREHDAIETLPVGFVFSVSLMSAAGIALYLIGWSANALLALLPALLLVLAVLVVARRRRRSAMPANDSRAERAAARGVAVLALCAAALMLYRGGLSTWSADTYDHVGTVREIVEGREIMPGDAFYGGEHSLGPDPRKGLFHTCLALLSIVTGIEPFRIWLWLPAFLLPILLCGYFSCARSLFKNGKIALLSSILFFVCFGGLDRGYLRTVGYPLFVAFQFYLIALYFLFRHLANGRARYLVAGAAIGCMISLVHVYYFFQFMLAIGSLFVFSWLLRRDDRGAMIAVAKLGLLTIVFSLPLLVLRYRLSYEIANPFDLQPRHLLFLTDTVFISNPLEAWKVLGPIGVLAFGAIPFLYRRARADTGILFLFSAMVATPLIILNPLAVEALGRIMTYGLVRRVVLLAPYVAVTGYCVHEAARALRGGAIARRRVAAILAYLALVAALLVPYAKGFADGYGPASVEAERRNSFLPWRDALAFMQERIIEPSVILSDPATSFSIPAFTRHHIVAVLIGHALPQDAENIERVAAADDVLNPFVDMRTTIELLKRYRVRYVVVNQTFDSSLYESYWSVDVTRYDAARRKFEDRPDVFERVYGRDRVFIYEFRAEAAAPASAGEESPLRPFVLEIAPSLQEAANAAFGDGIVLLGVSIEAPAVRRGERLTMKCYWKCAAEDTAVKDYRVFVRFDAQAAEGAPSGGRFSKVRRIVMQRMTGHRYRFRSERSPVNGVYPPRHWRKGEIIEDEFEIAIPSDVAAGPYEVRINLMSLPFSPNYSLRDLLSDEDVYAGKRVGVVAVE